MSWNWNTDSIIRFSAGSTTPLRSPSVTIDIIRRSTCSASSRAGGAPVSRRTSSSRLCSSVVIGASTRLSNCRVGSMLASSGSPAYFAQALGMATENTSITANAASPVRARNSHQLAPATQSNAWASTRITRIRMLNRMRSVAAR